MTAHPGPALLIAQITDFHIGFVADDPDEPNRHRLDRLIDALLALDPAPDLIVATGDLVDRGDPGSYAFVRAALSRLPQPVLPLLGNHDRRATFAAAFPDYPLEAGYLQYVVDHAGLRIVGIDTLDEARHGGAFCPARAAWLSRMLDDAPARPTLILLHHPPLPAGIPWMDTDPAEPWVARLRDVVAGRANIVAMLAGHVHRPVATRWHGIPLVIAPSCAPEVALAMRPIDPLVPDGRPMIVASHPGYALHRWDGVDLLTHFVTLDPHPVIAVFDRSLQPMVAEMLAERPGPDHDDAAPNRSC